MNSADTWFWAHDVRAGQIDSLAVPGTRLVRLAQYDLGVGRRFVALAHGGAGRATYALDMADPGGLGSVAAITGTRATGFTVVLDPAGPPTEVRPGLDVAALVALPAAGLRVVDMTPDGGAGTFTAVVTAVAARADGQSSAVAARAGGGSSVVLAGATERELDRRHRAAGVEPVRVRAVPGGGFVSIAEPRRGGVRWRTGLDADAVGRALNRRRSWPLDLDPVATPRGLRFTVVLRSG